jgi:hypothetical protein
MNEKNRYGQNFGEQGAPRSPAEVFTVSQLKDGGAHGNPVLL